MIQEAFMVRSDTATSHEHQYLSIFCSFQLLLMLMLPIFCLLLLAAMARKLQETPLQTAACDAALR